MLTGNPAKLSFCLKKYVVSTRKKTGDPPRTIHLLLSGLQQYNKQVTVDIFGKESVEFKQLMITCDSFYRELREKGVGAAVT